MSLIGYNIMNNSRKKQFFREFLFKINIFTKIFAQSKNFVSLQRVSLIRPAPVELPQGRKAARVDGRAVRYK